MFLTNAIAYRFPEISSLVTQKPLLATVEAENAPIVLTGVLLSLVVIYVASKISAEISKRLDFQARSLQTTLQIKPDRVKLKFNIFIQAFSS